MIQADPRRGILAMAVVVIANLLILGHFYDRFCWLPDDGHYAHVAERILDGEIVHADIEDFHTDNTHAVNTAALALFGRDLRSLRVPLVFATLAQSLIMFGLFRARSRRTAIVAALSLSSLSFVQYLNPQPHWYCLVLAVASVAVLARYEPRSFARLALLGALVGTAFLFRQLTGVFLGMGVLAYLLIENPDGGGGSDRGLGARLLLALMAVAQVAYCLRATNLTGFLMFGLWPVTVLVWSVGRCRTSTRALVGILAGLGSGAILAAIPTVAYHALHGSLTAWLRDCLLTAFGVEGLPYLTAHRYAGFVTTAVEELFAGGGAVSIANNLYWLTLPLMGALNGALLLRHLVRLPAGARVDMALPVIAAFYGLVSLFNQIPMYLYYTVGLSLAGVLWTRTVSAGAGARSSWWEPVAVALTVVGLVFHAGQPATRTLRDVVAGVTIPLVENTRIPRASLWIERLTVDTYGDLIDLVHRETETAESIFVLPNHPELYFLAGRKNPFWFPNTSLALRTPAELNRVLQQLRDRPPALVIYATRDRHRTAMSDAIMELVERSHSRIATIGEFAVYRHPNAGGGREQGA